MADAQKEELRGNQRYSSSASGYNAIYFMMERMLKDRVNTALPVKVVEVFPREEQQPEPEPQEPVSPDQPGEDEGRFPQPEMVGFLSALPLISPYQSGPGGTKKALNPVAIPKLPYFRLQGGLAAVVNDPQPGDIGIAIFAQQDISRLFGLETSDEDGGDGGGSDLPSESGEQDDTQQPVLPGSFRVFDMSDGMYLGGILNKAPVAWIEFKQNGAGEPDPDTGEETDPLITINIKSTENLEFRAVKEFYVEAKNVTIKVEELFKLTAKNVEIDTEEAIKIKAETSIDIESGEGMTIKSGETLALESAEDMTLKSETNVGIEAAEKITIKAPDALEVESSLVDIKADTTKMSGDLEVAGKIKGGDIQGDTVKAGNIDLGTHRHTAPSGGGSTSGPF